MRIQFRSRPLLLVDINAMYMQNQTKRRPLRDNKQSKRYCENHDQWIKRYTLLVRLPTPRTKCVLVIQS